MDTKLNRLNFFKVIVYLLFFPITILKVIVERIRYLFNKFRFNRYFYGEYIKNRNWVPKGNYKNTKSSFTAITVLYLSIFLYSYFYDYFVNYKIISLVYLLISYIHIRDYYLNKKLLKQLNELKTFFMKIEETEIYLVTKKDELTSYFNTNQLDHEIKCFNQFIQMLTIYINNYDIVNEVLGFNDLITNQYQEILNYLKRQNNVILKCLKQTDELKNNRKKIKKRYFENITIDEEIIIQNNECRELYKTYIQYKAIFHTYIKDNLPHIIHFEQPFTQEFINYLINIRVYQDFINHLPDEPLLEFISYNYTLLNINQLKEIVSNRNELINRGNREGNTILHFAVIHNQVELIQFLLISGVNVNCQNNQGCSPLFYARKNKHNPIINLLIVNNAVESDNNELEKGIVVDKMKKDKKDKRTDYDYNLNGKISFDQQSGIEIYLENKVNELNHYIDLKKIEKEIKKIKQFVEWLNVYKHNSDLMNEVLEFKEIIVNQYNEIGNYFNNQLNYIKSLLSKINEVSIDQLKIDKQIINQSNDCRNMCDQFIQYIAIFNSFIKDNLTNIVNINQPLCKEFLDYLEESRIFDTLIKKLDEYLLFEFLTHNFLKLNINQITSIVIGKSDLLNKKDRDGNTLLDLAVIHNQDKLIRFLQGCDNSDFLIKTIVA